MVAQLKQTEEIVTQWKIEDEKCEKMWSVKKFLTVWLKSIAGKWFFFWVIF